MKVRSDEPATALDTAVASPLRQLWTETAINPAGGGTTIATVRLHQGVFKDSNPGYPREAQADAPA